MLIVEIVGALKVKGKKMDVPTKRELSKEIGEVIKSLAELGVRIEKSLQISIINPDFISRPEIVEVRIRGLVREDWGSVLRNKFAYGVAKAIEDRCPEMVVHCFIDRHDPVLTYQTVGEQENALVHSLDPHDRARCGFSSKSKEDWPNNHRGVTVAEDVTCPACIATRS